MEKRRPGARTCVGSLKASVSVSVCVKEKDRTRRLLALVVVVPVVDVAVVLAVVLRVVELCSTTMVRLAFDWTRMSQSCMLY